MLLLPLFVFLFGLIIGSFLNVVILRLNTGRSIARGRSACARCNIPLTWYELIPVLSFLSLRGKCKSCKKPISFQYPLVELLTAIVFTFIYSSTVAQHGLTVMALIMGVFSMVVASLLLVIFVYDIRHTIIPDIIVYLFIIASLIAIIWQYFTVPGFNPLLAVVNGVLVALPFFLLWFFSKGAFMGFGDVKLALGMGWLLGLTGGLSAVLFSFWIGGIIGLFLLALTRKYSMRSQIPFAPFLIAGTFIVGVWGVTIISLFQLWQ